MKHNLLIISLAFFSGIAVAQVPMNAAKRYEYTEATTVSRAGTKELQRRFILWAKDYYKKDSHTILVDDSNYRFVTVRVTQKMPNSFFQVNRSHKDRELTYTLIFDTDRKNYTYWINDFEYKCIEVDKKGNEVPFQGKLELFATPSKASLSKEIDEHIKGVITAFKKGGEKDVPLEVKDEMDKADAERKAQRDADAAERAAKAKEAAAEEAARIKAEEAEEAARIKAEAAAELARKKAEEAEAKAAADAERDRIKAEEAAARAAAAEQAKAERDRQAAERKAAMEARKPVSKTATKPEATSPGVEDEVDDSPEKTEEVPE